MVLRKTLAILKARPPGCKSWLPHLQAVWPRANYLKLAMSWLLIRKSSSPCELWICKRLKMKSGMQKCYITVGWCYKDWFKGWESVPKNYSGSSCSPTCGREGAFLDVANSWGRPRWWTTHFFILIFPLSPPHFPHFWEKRPTGRTICLQEPPTRCLRDGAWSESHSSREMPWVFLNSVGMIKISFDHFYGNFSKSHPRL